MSVRRSLPFVCLAFLLASCGASASLALRSDASASLSLSLEVPVAVDAKIRQFAEAGGAGRPGAPLFDAASIAASLAARCALVGESVTPNPRSYRGSFSVPDLRRLLASDPELSKAIRYEQGEGWAALELVIDRGNAQAVVRLFPGIDEALLESLQPPALYDNPVNALEYRTMLVGLLGRTAVAAIDTLAFDLAIALPGPILEAKGAVEARAGERVARLRIPALAAMVLEEPVSMSLRWRR